MIRSAPSEAGLRSLLDHYPGPGVRKLRAAVLLLAIAAGQLQSVAQTFAPSVGVISLVDDALIVVALVLSVPLIGRAPALPAAIALGWLFFALTALILTATFGPAPSSVAVALFRQISIPAVVMLIGLTIAKDEWFRIAKFVIALGIVNALYIAIEVVLGPLISPVALARANNYRIYADGFPSTYHGNDFITGDRIIRAGGLIMNPPTMSLFIAVALVLSFYLLQGRSRWLATLSLAAALYATNGRGGIVLALIGLFAPILFARIGSWASLILIAIVGVNVGGQVAEHGGSDKHLGGLVAGISHAISYPLGRGFGYVGNSSNPELIESGDGGAESLLGIAFSAVGMLAVVIVCVAAIAYAWLLRSTVRNYAASIGLGALVASLFVESAAALNGTIPIWLAAGVAFIPAAFKGRMNSGPAGRAKQNRDGAW